MLPEEASVMKAEKHIWISKQIKEATEENLAGLNPSVYLATHPCGRYGKYYRECEERSREDFWGITIHSEKEPKKGTKLKIPDAVITEGNKCLYVIEVKWGWVPDFYSKDQISDLHIGKEELEETEKAISDGKICRVGKHAVFGKPTPMPEPEDPDFEITGETKFLLISDFCGLKEGHPKYNAVMKELLAQLPAKLVYLDHQRTHENPLGIVIKSFRDYVLANSLSS